MKCGERRGPLPEEEYIWLRQHLRCRSINHLFAEYSQVFGSPYSTKDSFRQVLLRNNLFPITEVKVCENVHHLIEMYYQGPCHWTYKGEEFRKGIIGTPHWLWKWHEMSIKTPSGVSFRQYPLKVEEIQYGSCETPAEEMDSRDPDKGSVTEQLHQCLPDELPQGK